MSGPGSLQSSPLKAAGSLSSPAPGEDTGMDLGSAPEPKAKKRKLSTRSSVSVSNKEAKLEHGPEPEPETKPANVGSKPNRKTGKLSKTKVFRKVPESKPEVETEEGETGLKPVQVEDRKVRNNRLVDRKNRRTKNLENSSGEFKGLDGGQRNNIKTTTSSTTTTTAATTAATTSTAATTATTAKSSKRQKSRKVDGKTKNNVSTDDNSTEVAGNVAKNSPDEIKTDVDSVKETNSQKGSHAVKVEDQAEVKPAKKAKKPGRPVKKVPKETEKEIPASPNKSSDKKNKSNKPNKSTGSAVTPLANGAVVSPAKSLLDKPSLDKKRKVDQSRSVMDLDEDKPLVRKAIILPILSRNHKGEIINAAAKVKSQAPEGKTGPKGVVPEVLKPELSNQEDKVEKPEPEPEPDNPGICSKPPRVIVPLILSRRKSSFEKANDCSKLEAETFDSKETVTKVEEQGIEPVTLSNNNVPGKPISGAPEFVPSPVKSEEPKSCEIAKSEMAAANVEASHPTTSLTSAAPLPKAAAAFSTTVPLSPPTAATSAPIPAAGAALLPKEDTTLATTSLGAASLTPSVTTTKSTSALGQSETPTTSATSPTGTTASAAIQSWTPSATQPSAAAATPSTTHGKAKAKQVDQDKIQTDFNHISSAATTTTSTTAAATLVTPITATATPSSGILRMCLSGQNLKGQTPAGAPNKQVYQDSMPKPEARIHANLPSGFTENYGQHQQQQFEPAKVQATTNLHGHTGTPGIGYYQPSASQRGTIADPSFHASKQLTTLVKPQPQQPPVAVSAAASQQNGVSHIGSAYPQQNMMACQPQAPIAYNPYAAVTSQTSTLPSQLQSGHQSYPTNSFQPVQNSPSTQMHQFQQLQHNLWQSYKSVNMAAAITQQAACQLNPQLPGTTGLPHAGGYYNLDLTSNPGHVNPMAHLMQPFSQSHHLVLNYAPTSGYGFMNQFMSQPHLPSDHQANAPANAQPGSQPVQPQAMFPGYPHHGYQTNFHP